MMHTAFASLSGPLFGRVQTLTLWLLAVLHMLVLASFLLIVGSLSPAHATDAPACTGTDLLTELKTSDPAAYARLRQEADKVPNGKGIFWKIEKPGIAPSWLLGTMHVTDPRVLKMPPGAREAQAQARVIAVESDEVLDEQKAMVALLMKPELTMLTDGRSIDTLLSSDDAQILKDGLTKRGVAYSAVSRMKPWMLMSLVALPSCELARKDGATTFLDKQIARDAGAAGKPVKGLETLEEQVNAINSLPMDLHLKSLIETIKLGSKADDVFYTMTQLYLSGEIGMLQPLLKVVAPDGTDDQSGYAKFDELLITRRNHLMAERAAPLLDTGAAFIAIGAAHLPGNEGLIQLFRQQGYTVTAAN